MKKNLAIIFGGDSVEHEISIITALQAMEHIDQNKYEIIPLYLSKDKKFYTHQDFFRIENFEKLDEISKKYKEKIIYQDEKNVFLLNKKKSFFKSKEEIKIDLFFPIVHGTNVEDGKLQGYLNMFDLPIIGPTTTSAVVGQEKSITKDILTTHKIKQTKYIWVKENQKEKIYHKIEDELNYPVIVKPNSLGSSIGIFIAKNEEELKNNIDKAFKYDNVLVIEEVLQDFEELNISVMEIDGKIITSSIEKVFANDQLLSYEDKYLTGNKKSGNTKNSANGMASVSRELPAKISLELQDKIENIAINVYEILCCQGIVRLDLLIKNEEVYLNEINSIPGSLSYYLWEEKGIKYNELLTKIIEDNTKKHFKKKNKIYSFKTNVLNMKKGKLK